MRNPCTCDYEYDKACKTDKYLDLKNYSCKKTSSGKLVLACKDEMLSTTDDKKLHLMIKK